VIASLDIAGVSNRLAGCAEELDQQGQRLQLMLFRLLSEGQPVAPAHLAERAGLPVAEIVALLSGWREVHVDEDARIVAFHGLSLVEAPHRLNVDGRTLYAWCAWDTVFLPELIGRSAEVESTCPATRETITLRVGSRGPADVSPPDAVLSFLLPGVQFGEDTLGSFCSYIHFFASPRTAHVWTAERPGTFVISIEDAFEIGRLTNAAQWGDALGPRERKPMPSRTTRR
jgi:alkylmercury lyase